MRRLGGVLGVDPMSLYNHVRDKDDLLDAMADTAVAGIDPTPGQGPWTERAAGDDHGGPRDDAAPPVGATSDRAACPTRTGDAALLRHRDRHPERRRLPIDLTHHALHLLGSRVIGFNQDLFDDRSEAARDPAASAADGQPAGGQPPVRRADGRTVSHEGGLGGCDDDASSPSRST